MTKKQDQTTQQDFGLAMRLPASMNSLIRYEAMVRAGNALTKTEERITSEFHKHLLVERYQAEKTRYGLQKMREIDTTAASEYNALIQHLKAIRETFTGDPYDIYADAFNHTIAQEATHHFSDAVAAGAGRIVEEINISLHREEEARKRILGIF